MQPLVFANLKWEEGHPETANYKCDHCGELIAERHKITMLANGEWVPAKPEKVNYDVIGFHINSLYSPYGWHSCAVTCGTTMPSAWHCHVIG